MEYNYEIILFKNKRKKKSVKKFITHKRALEYYNKLIELIKSKYKEKYIVGTGFNSLGETINLMEVATTLDFTKFLIMPPAFYKFGDKDVINYYSKIEEKINEPDALKGYDADGYVFAPNESTETEFVFLRD